MSLQILNARKKELIDAQDKMLRNAVESKVALSVADEASFANMTTELDSINTNISRFQAIEKNRQEVAVPSNSFVIPVNSTTTAAQFMALGGKVNRTPLPNVTADYAKKFWASMRSQAEHQQFLNANLGEGGTSAAGGALVPIETATTIAPLQIEETIARSYSRVIPTTMNLELPSQTSVTQAAIKPESNSTGTNSFINNPGTYGTTTLLSFMFGALSVVSWELQQDFAAIQAFVPADIMRGITVSEEHQFVNGAGGSTAPQGYLGAGLTAFGPGITAGAGALSLETIISTMGSLLQAYYSNAKWLFNRQEFNRLLLSQLQQNQFQTFITYDPTGAARLFGYPVGFSGEMPVFNASPATTGAVIFGAFDQAFVIGDRFGSDVRIQVNPYLLQSNGQTQILGYRRSDQRCLVPQAVVQLNTNA